MALPARRVFELSQNVAIPSSAADWFSFESIAQVERDSLPEFFTGIYPSKTP